MNNGSGMLSLTRLRTEEIFDGLRRTIFVETDRLFAILMAVQWVFGVVVAYIVSPRAWAGSTSEIHIHVWAAILLGGAISSFPIVLALTRPGRLTTRYVIAIGQMLTSSLLIHLTGGRIETHFHVFGSLAFLAFYRDWRVLVPATIVVVADHLLRGIFWPQSVYGVLTASPWRSLEHAGWVVFEDIVLVVSCLRGTGELRRVAERTAQFETSEERYKAVVEQTAEGIFVFEVERNAILECNAAFARMLGASPDVVTGLTVGDVMNTGGDDRERTVEDAHGESVITVAERLLRRLDGTVTEVECSLSPTIYGHQPAMCAVVRDISERKRIEASLAKTRDAAIEGSRAKSEFLANMSHEIRTPMNGIIGMADLALDTELSAQQRDYLVTVKSSANSLLAILNDILDFSKIESRKLDLETIPFSVRDVVGEMLKPLIVEANQKGLELRFGVDPVVPAGIIGDPVRLQQVLTNLVGNAIKFTEHGRVSVDIREDTRTEGSTRLHFQISDTGIGIPAEKHSTIFEAFSQADGSTTRRFGGTGLGLTISSNLVLLMGGRIWVDSEPGKGSIFHFTAGFDIGELGAAKPAPEPRLTDLPVPIVDGNPTPSTGQPARKLKILLAEDNVVNQRVAVGLLEKRGHDITVANNGLEALAELERGAFDVVLMDVQMPEMDGLEATAAIRERERVDGGHLRIVAMTAHAMKGDRERCLDAGMDGYLSKPIEPSLLYASLEHQIHAIGPAGAAASGTPTAGSPVDLERLMRRLGGDKELLTEVVRLFLDDCPARVAAIKAAVDSRDAALIRTTAHALKGAAATLSAHKLFDSARTLERLGAEGRLDAAEAAWRQLSMDATSAIDTLRQYQATPLKDLACAS